VSRYDPPGRRPRRTDREQLRRDVLQGLEHGLPLTVVARRHETTQRQIDHWARGDPKLADEIAGARALGWDNLAVECLEIIDDRSQDVIYDSDGDPRFNTAAVLRARAQCDVRLRLLACWDVGRYGPQKTLKVEGEVTQTHTIDPHLLSEEARAALRAVLAHARARGLLAGPEPQDAEFEEIEELGPKEDVADG
jgi:hypothetical protein